MIASHSMSKVCPSLHYSRVMEHRAVYWSEILLLSQHSGGSVVHSYGRLIPHEFPITNPQQIFGPDERITCTVSSGTAEFKIPVTKTKIGGMNQTAVLVLNTTSGSHQSKDLYCNSNDTNSFYLYINSSNNSE